MPRQDYEERVERRRERLEERAEKMRTESTRRYERAMSELEYIPPGQPILVGHHSERGHRAALKRHDNNMRKAIDADQQAGNLAGRAASVGKGGISSDDPQAVKKLREKLEALKAHQQHMKDFNKAHRAWTKKPDAPATLKLLAAFREDQQAQLKAYVPRYSWEPHPFAPFELQNNGANIKRIEKRIADLERAETMPERAPVRGDGWEIWEDRDENRLFIRHDQKPSAEVRAHLKCHGFRWNRYAVAWSRMLNEAAWTNAQYLAENGKLD